MPRNAAQQIKQAEPVAQSLQRDLRDNPIDFGNANEGWDPKPALKYRDALASTRPVPEYNSHFFSVWGTSYRPSRLVSNWFAKARSAWGLR